MLTCRERNYGEIEELSKRKRLLKSKCYYRDAQIKKLIKKQRVKMIDKDNEDMHRLMNELTPHVENKFDKDSPQYMLWKEQVMKPRHKCAGTL